MVKRKPSPMMGKSKVVLAKDLASIGGKAGDLVTVRTGFYLNFLYPRGLAEKATDEALQKLAEATAAEEAAEEAARDAASTIRDKLEALDGVVILKKVGERGAIFGSVSASDLVSALESASSLKLGSPKVTFETISSVGRYTAQVALHSTVTAEVNFQIAATT